MKLDDDPESKAYRATHPLSLRLFNYRGCRKYGAKPDPDYLDLLAECVKFIEDEETRRQKKKP